MTDKQRVQGDQFVLISEIDSKQRNIKDGDNVVFNDRGSIKVLQITSDVSSGIVVSTLGYWRQLNDGTVNSISH